MYNGQKGIINFRRQLALLILAVILCISGMAAGLDMPQVYGAQTRVVKVGFFPMDGFNEKNEDGTYGGMDVEYLEAIRDYVNWDIEYVECESWDDALQLLADRKIDLVGSAQYSSKRAEIYPLARFAY